MHFAQLSARVELVPFPAIFANRSTGRIRALLAPTFPTNFEYRKPGLRVGKRKRARHSGVPYKIVAFRTYGHVVLFPNDLAVATPRSLSIMGACHLLVPTRFTLVAHRRENLQVKLC